MALSSTVKTDLYRFFAIAFDAAPGVTYMNQLAEASAAGMTVQQIVEVFTNKPQFTSVYPTFFTNEQFAAKLINNVVGTSATEAAKAEAAAQIVSALALGGEWTRGKVIYTIFNNLANKAADDAVWGNTSKQMANQVAYAQYYTEEMLGDTTDMTALRAVIANVTPTSSTAAADIAAALTPAAAAQTFTLTTGVDALTGTAGNDVFNATGATLNALDSVDGGAGSNTLNIVDSTGASASGLAAATLKNIQTLNVAASGAVGTLAAAASGTAASATSTFVFPATGASDTVTLNIGGLSVVIAGSATQGTVASNATAAITAALSSLGYTVSNTAASSTAIGVVNNHSTTAGQVVITGLTSGAALPSISVTGATTGADYPSLANVAGTTVTSAVTEVAYDASGITGLTALTVANSTSADVAVAATTAATITSTGAVTLAGGTTQTVTAAGVTTLSGATGAITATNTSGASTITGGSTVNLTHKSTGAVSIGSGTTVSKNPTGAVTVSATKNAAVTVYGGTDASITATGGAVTLGGTAAATNKAPTGAVTITNKSYNGQGVGAVAVNGGNGVTVTTGGGLSGSGSSVTVGSYTSSTINGVAAGAVSITDNNSTVTGNADAFTVKGGTTVGITTTTTSGAVNVGVAAALNAAGTGLNAETLASDPTGNVTIVNGTSAKYGTSATAVYTNGATSVSVTGAGTLTVVDAQTKLATAGTNAGKAIGASTLASVSLEGVSDTVALTSDALTNLSIKNSSASASKTVTVNNSTAGHTLALTLENARYSSTGPVVLTVQDDVATAVTVGTNGTSSNSVALSGAKLNTVTFNNSAALTLRGLTMTAPAAATSTTAAIDDTIVANNTGTLALGDLSGAVYSTTGFLKSITATGTGAVSVKIDASKTSFAGGAGNDTVTIAVGSGITKAIAGGAGNNTLIVDAASSGALNANTYISGFQTLGMGASADNSSSGNFDATGFANLSVAQTITGDSTFANVQNGANLSVTANTAAITGTQKAITASLATDTTNDTITVNLGVDGPATGATAGVNLGASSYNSLLTLSGIENLNLNSYGVTTGKNYVTVTDTSAKAITLAGDSGITLTLASAPVATINASAMTAGAVDVTGVTLKTTGATITGGAGKLTAIGGVTTTAADVLTTGAGGGALTVGLAGANNSAGSTTINLGASAAVADTISLYNTQASSHNDYALVSTVNGFAVASSGATGDKLSFEGVVSSARAAVSKVVMTTAATGTTANSGAESYTIANGMMTFTPVGVNSASSLATQLADASYAVARANSGANAVVAFNYGGDAYVVSSGDTATSSVADKVNVTKLAGVTLSNIGNAAAAGSLVANVSISATGSSGSAVASTAAGVTTNTTDQTGYSGATKTTTGSTTAVTSTVTKYANLGSYAEVTIGNSATSGSTYTHSGSYEFTQTGAAGSNNLKLIFGASSYDQSQVVDKITVNGDWAVTLDSSGLASTKTVEVTNLVDATNTVTTINMVGNRGAQLDQVISSSLKTIDASAATGAVQLGQAVGTGSGPLANAGLTVKASTAATTAYLSGDTDVVTLNSTTTANVGGGSFYLSGANATVSAATAGTLQNALTIYASGTGATIDLSKVTTASSKAATIYGATSSDGVAANATVKLGVGANITDVQTVYAGVNTTVSIGGNYETVNVTKAAAAYGTTTNMTTIQLGTNSSGTALTAFATGDNIAFNSTSSLTNVNVSSATSLASALAIADVVAEAAGTDALAWFQYGGDTYLLQNHSATSATAVDAGDIVVKVVGIADVTSQSSGVVTLA